MNDARSLFALILSIAFAQSAGIIGSVFTVSSVRTWYLTLTQPSFSPPSWVFGPVWVTLYTLMGVAAFLVWQRRNKKGARRALWVYGVHLLFNTAWSIIFFGLQRPDLAFIEIVLLLALIVWTTVLFWRIDRRAGYLLLPYIAWVSFATILNGAIWLLN